MKKHFIYSLALFLIVNITVLLFKAQLSHMHIDIYVLLVGNATIYIATLMSTIFYMKSIKSKNAQGVIRDIYLGFMIKFFAILIIAIIYIATAASINKLSLFICMGLYAIYHILSTQNVLSLQKNTAKDAKRKSSL